MEIGLNRKYSFLADENRQHSALELPAFIFNDLRYLNLSPEKVISFYLKNNKSDTVAGSCHFQCDQDTAWSPLHAPFASIFLQENIGFQLTGAFIRAMIQYLKERKISRIILGHYPDFYAVTAPDKLIAALLFEGFQIKQTDINHFIVIREDPFDAMVRAMQRRRIQKCGRMGYIFASHKNNELEIVFRKIQEFRSQKNIPVSISMDRLKALFKQFPDRYFLFSVRDHEKIISATVMVAVNSTTVYNFLPASDEAYSTSSPMVYLIKNVYEFFRKRNYKYLDMGVSSLENKPQSGLISFKENLGGIPGIKFQLVKNID